MGIYIMQPKMKFNGFHNLRTTICDNNVFIICDFNSFKFLLMLLILSFSIYV